MGFFDSIADGFEEVWSGIGNVAEHIEKDVGSVLSHAEHDVAGVVNWGGNVIDKAEDTAIGAVNMMEYLPYVAAGLVIFLVMNSNKTSQVIDSGARAASQFR